MKKKTSALVASLATIAMCTNLVVGATYALFTSESEVNIAVTSGKVDVKATLANLEYQTLTVNTWTPATDNYTEFDGIGGSAEINGATLTLDKIVPGDAVKFAVNITNESTVNVKYRVLVENDESKDLGLFDGLDVKVDGEEFDGEAVSKWAELAPDVVDVKTVNVEIALPNTGDPAIDNQYNGQNNSCEIVVSVEAVQGNATVKDPADEWDGTADASWYDESETEFLITSAEQLAGFAELVDAGTTFEGKTVKLEGDLDLGKLDENGEPICFDPIGSYRNEKAFNGTFDGQGNTIYNLSQNTWALNNGYYYGDLGLGLFGAVENAHIKDLNVDNASISGESGLCGIVAATSFGTTTFENITVKNSDVADYQYYAGGIVGWASGEQTFINCDVDASTTIAAQWGEFNNANGGLIGGASASGKYTFKDCDVACVIDGFNDVTSAYEWYAYRRCGMLIGDTGSTKEIDGTTYAAAPNVTCENVTVTYGEWADYTYCQFNAMAYPWVRVQAGVSTGAYSNPRYGHPTDANGNEVVDDNHVHNDGEGHHVLIVFDQLFGGPGGDRYCTYGWNTHDGVTVIYNNPSKQASNN